MWLSSAIFAGKGAGNDREQSAQSTRPLYTTIMDKISTPHTGLTTSQAQASRLLHGKNELTPRPPASRWKLFLEKFEDPIIIILLIAMALSLLSSSYEYFITKSDTTGAGFFEPVGVFLAILLSTGIAFYFELKSEREFELLSQAGDEVLYKVLRDGHVTQLPKREIVVGDLLYLETGEEVPADTELLEAVSLSVDESTLTGEPVTRKSTRPEAQDKEATYPTNYICRGTTILEGHALCCVQAVGDATEQGKIFEGIQIDTSVETPLNRQLEHLSTLIARVSYVLAALILVGSTLVYIHDGGFSAPWDATLAYFLSKLMLAVTVIVVAVPEGLPMSVSLSLAYSMRSMMRSNNLIRRMHACETMGAITVICTDKTGTLTENRMRVQEFFSIASEGTQALLPEAIGCNTTAFVNAEDLKHPEVIGNPTEGALLLWLKERGIDYLFHRESVPTLQQLPFSTERKYMATLVQSASLEGKQVLYIKGAPELILDRCSLTHEERAAYEAKLKHYQAHAMRTLALAYHIVSTTIDATTSLATITQEELQLQGIFGISDPIRSEVPEAIRLCQGAGIGIKIITGDTAGTAKEIARQIGLWDDTSTPDELISGSDFAALSDEDAKARLTHLKIMARARPMDKERLVRLLQEMGQVVAVTGDGTNDAPALHRAHVGLSMGDGTAVAKEASDITILDSSFASIAQAVLWGRSLYLNIQRFILFQMTINVVACLTVLIGAFLGKESPLTVTQMLWVNLIMDTFASLALASLPPSPQLMKEQPRKPSAGIITPQLARHIFGVGLLFLILLFGLHYLLEHFDLATWQWSEAKGGLTALDLSVFFTSFVFLQLWNMFNAKAFHSGASAFVGMKKARNFLLITALILIGQLVITTFAYDFFQIAPLPLRYWIVLLVATSPVLWLGELGRLLARLTQGLRASVIR